MTERSQGADMIDIDGVRTSLQPAVDMLAADGYELNVNSDQHRVRIEVTAGPDACVECLVPRDLMLSILHQMIDPTSTGPTMPLELVYPTDTVH